MKDKTKILTTTQLTYGVAVFVFGIVLAVWPELIPDLIMNIVGAVLIVSGAVSMIRYFRMDVKESLSSYDMVGGMLLIAGGILLIIFKHAIQNFIPAICAIVFLFCGIMKLQATVSFKRMNASKWYIELALSLLSIIVGIVILCNLTAARETMYRLIGIALIVESVTDTGSVAVRNKKSFEYVETTFTKE